MFDKKASHSYKEVHFVDTLQTLVESRGGSVWLAALGRSQKAWGSLNDEKALRSRDWEKGAEFPALPADMA